MTTSRFRAGSSRSPLILWSLGAAGLIFSLTISSCAGPSGGDIHAVFRCPDGGIIDTTFREKEVTVILPDGTRKLLPQAMSASGARYSDNVTTLWNKGDTAFIVSGDKIVWEGCTAEE